MPHPLPRYLNREVTRHGKAVWYVRVGKGPRIKKLTAEFGTAEFEIEYQAAISGKTQPRKSGPLAGSLAWLIDRYLETQAWTSLSMATRRQRENILKQIIGSAGSQRYTAITAATIAAGRDRRSQTPFQARHFLDTGSLKLFEWAKDAKFVKENPAAAVKYPLLKSGDGFPVWTEDDVAAQKVTSSPSSSSGRRTGVVSSGGSGGRLRPPPAPSALPTSTSSPSPTTSTRRWRRSSTRTRSGERAAPASPAGSAPRARGRTPSSPAHPRRIGTVVPLILLAVVAVALVVVVLGVASGGVAVDPLAEAVRSTPDHGLPPAPQAADVDGVRFDTALGATAWWRSTPSSTSSATTWPSASGPSPTCDAPTVPRAGEGMAFTVIRHTPLVPEVAWSAVADLAQQTRDVPLTTMEVPLRRPGPRLGGRRLDAPRPPRLRRPHAPHRTGARAPAALRQDRARPSRLGGHRRRRRPRRARRGAGHVDRGAVAARAPLPTSPVGDRLGPRLFGGILEGVLQRAAADAVRPVRGSDP